MLRQQWAQPEHTGLASDFLAGQAPWLLQFDAIGTKQRQWLEQAAWKRPRETNRVFRLFPQVADPKGLTAARVSARLIRQADNEQVAEAFYPAIGD